MSNLSYLQFDLLKHYPGIAHGSFSRSGGFSSSFFEGLNVSFDVGDLSSHVEENLALIRKELGIMDLIQCDQCHGDEVLLLDKIPFERPTCDALITNRKNIGLLIKHADCQAALFYDPVNHAIGAAHSGWRGSIAKIYTKTINAMQKNFGTDPENILIGISPFLGKEHAEFKNYKDEFPEDFWKYQVKPNFFDFAAIAMNELNNAGVLSKHVNISSVCTFANAENWFSYRREKVTGRHGTVIALR